MKISKKCMTACSIVCSCIAVLLYIACFVLGMLGYYAAFMYVLEACMFFIILAFFMACFGIE